jgi:hypothetical protein
VTDPSDADLVARAVRTCVNADRPLWAVVADRFAIGSTLARELCCRHGLDPDEIRTQPDHPVDPGAGLDSDDEWRELDALCKAATGFHARDIVLPLIAAEHDPHGEAYYNADGPTGLLANILGSAGDTNARAAAAAICAVLEDAGYPLLYNDSRHWYRVVGQRVTDDDIYLLGNALRMIRGVVSATIVSSDEADLVYLVQAEGPTGPILRAMAAIKGVTSATLRRLTRQ